MQTTKNAICLVILSVFFGLNLFAQGRNLSLKDKNDASWSLGVKGGVDYFFVKPHAERETKFKTAVLQASWVAPLIFGEYTYNKIFAFGLESGYFVYNRGGLNGSYSGGTVDAVLYASFNLSNAIDKYRHGGIRQRVSWYGYAGLGCGYYYYKNSYKGNDVTQNDNGVAPLGFLSIACAVNLTDYWEIFGEGQYRFYFARNMGGEKVKAFTNALAVVLGVRLKIY